MSVRVIEQVWKTSQQHGNPLLVLLALADFADDDGVAYPSIGRLARKVRLQERAVHRIVAELVADKELRIERSPGRVNHYRVTPRGVAEDAPLNGHAPLHHDAPTPAPSATPPLHAGPPKPSIEPSMNRQGVRPTQNLTEEMTCPMGPHTFSGSYSEHLAHDPRHQVRKREAVHG